MLSIWEKNSFLHYDHIILGGGIVGLSTAYYLSQRFPKEDILVLERGLLPSGASTKNAGFACMGSVGELVADLTHQTPEEVLELFLLRKRGLERLRSMIGDKAMHYQSNGSYELLFEKDKALLDQIDYLNDLLGKELNVKAFKLADDKIQQFGFDQQKIVTMIENCCEGEIDTGQMMKQLSKLVASSGVSIKTGCVVKGFEEMPQHVSIRCSNGSHNEELTLTARKFYLCNNAFASEFLPSHDIQPGRGQVLVTQPLAELPFKGIFHFEQGYYYFREYQGRVLFGGGRNLDIENERSTQFILNQKIQDDLEMKLREIILSGRPFEIDMRWSGIMAFGNDKQPYIEKLSDRIYIGVRMGGMGVAIGSEVGFQLAALST